MDCAKRNCGTEAAVGLPDDPLVDILSRVPVKSICRCKCVSKAWRDVIADPLHRKKLPQTLEGFFFMGDESYGFVDVSLRSVRLVDFSYLTELPGIKNTKLVQCCNGLLLFAAQRNRGSSWSYVVCNPATKQCVAVPSSGLNQDEIFYGAALTYLLFDPAAAGVPCHFSLVEFSRGRSQKSVRVYSSKTQAWSHNKPEWLVCYSIAYPSVYVDGMVHLISYLDELIVLDVEGNKQKFIPPPCRTGRERWTTFDYIGWSQGCLHYINHEAPDDVEETGGDGCGHTEPSFRGFVIWVLEDYERQRWVLKDTVSFSKLLDEKVDKDIIDFDYDVVGIHPDHGLVFLVQVWDLKLISYHMDSKEVRDLCTLGHGYEFITPYVPCFSEFLALENKQ